MTSFALTTANISPGEGAIVRQYQAAAAITAAPGKQVSLDSNGKLTLAVQNSSAALARAIGVIVQTTSMYGETSVAADGWCSVCEFGPVHGYSSLTPGTNGWVSATAGDIEGTKPSSGFQLSTGIAVAADTYFVNPGPSYPAST